MNATQKMIAAVAIVAVLAVAAVGAGFAYTASTSNSGNQVDTVFFKLSQGDEVASYSDSFDVGITYDSETFIAGMITSLDDEMDEDILADTTVAAKKTAYVTAGDTYLTKYKAIFSDYAGTDAKQIKDDTTNQNNLATLAVAKAAYETEVTEETAQAYLDAYKAIFDDYTGDAAGIAADEGTTMIAANAAAKEAYDEAVAAFIDAYNAKAAQVLTTMTINGVKVGEDDAKLALFDDSQATISEITEPLVAYVDAYKAIFTGYTGDAFGIAKDTENQTKLATLAVAKAAYETEVTEETAQAYLDAYKAIFDDYTGDAAGIAADEGTTKLTTLAQKEETFDAAVEANTVYYNLSGDGKSLTVSVSDDEEAIPAYTFKVEAEGELDIVNYSYIIGVKFGDGDMVYKAFDGDEISFVSGSNDEEDPQPGESAITLMLFLAEEGTAGPEDKPYSDLTFNFTVDSVVA